MCYRYLGDEQRSFLSNDLFCSVLLRLLGAVVRARRPCSPDGGLAEGVAAAQDDRVLHEIQGDGVEQPVESGKLC